MDQLEKALKEEMAETYGIGSRIVQSVPFYFRQKENQCQIERLRKASASTREEGVTADPRPLAGKIFVLTGGPEGFTRYEAKDLIVRQGGRVDSSVSSKTDYVVVGKDHGSKYDDAKHLGVPTLDESAFERLIGRE